MDIGIAVPNISRPATPEAILRIPGAADELGFHSVWLGDHIVRPVGDHLIDYFKHSDRYTWDLYEPLVTAGFVAATTKRVKIGFGVLVLPYRNPVITAKQIASLDQLSGGRVILGVGAGYWPEEFRALNIPQRDTGARTDEYIDLFRALWSDERPSFHGEHVVVDAILFKPRPVQDHIPIWVGGMSTAAMRRALARGDGWHVPRFTVEGMEQLLRRFEEIASEEGLDASRIVISNRPEVRFAPEPQQRDTQRFEEGDPAPTATPIVGPPDFVAEELARFAELGVDHLVVDLHEGDPLPDVLDALETFASDVMPLLGGS